MGSEIGPGRHTYHKCYHRTSGYDNEGRKEIFLNKAHNEPDQTRHHDDASVEEVARRLTNKILSKRERERFSDFCVHTKIQKKV